VSAETLSAFQRQAPDLFAPPRFAACVFTQLRGFRGLAASPYLARLDELELDAAGSAMTAQALSVSPHATGLRRLGCARTALARPVAAALARSPYLTGVTGTASGRQTTSETRGRGPADSPNLTRLTVTRSVRQRRGPTTGHGLWRTRGTSAGWRCWTSAAIATRSPMRGRWHWPVARPAGP